jgi:hypothetical protein
MHIEKRSLVNKKVAAATIFARNSRRVDLSKPASFRVLTAFTRASGDKRVRYM